MLKCLGFMIIMLAAISMGYVRCKKLTLRVNFLTEYLQFINYLEAEMRYSSDLIQELVKKYCSPTLSNFLSCFSKNMDTGQTLKNAWVTALSNEKKSFGLDEADAELIHNFGTNLGNSDIESQISYCKMNKQLINSRIALAREEKDKKAKLYFILYFFAGLSIVLFLL